MFPRDVTIAVAGGERVAELEQLFRALHAHHVALAPRLGGLAARSADEAWRLRRTRYEAWLAQPDGLLLVAEHPDGIVGFALAGTAPGYQTWESAERVGELHELAVAPGERGAGIGGALLDRLEAELAAGGLREYRLLVLSANDEARRLYERRGMQRVSDVMLGRIAPAPAAGSAADSQRPLRRALDVPHILGP